MSKKQAASRNLTFAVPVKLTPAIDKKVEDAAAETGLKKSDVIRMAVERGIDVLLSQLNSSPRATA